MNIPSWRRIMIVLFITVALFAAVLMSVARADFDPGRFMMDHFNWTFNIYRFNARKLAVLVYRYL